MTRSALLLAALLSAGCATDTLYTFCTNGDQCGSRTYEDDEVEYTVDLQCIEVEVDVTAERTTHGSQCTLPCSSDRDCTSRIGLPRGVCIAWADEDDFYCYARCESDDDCYPSSACEEVSLDGEPTRVCLPARL